MQTGISGKTLVNRRAPLMGFIPLLRASLAEWSCFADSLTASFTRIPYSPCSSVVPAVLPPVWMGTRPLCAFLYFVLRGVRDVLVRICCWCCCCGGARSSEAHGCSRLDADVEANGGATDARRNTLRRSIAVLLVVMCGCPEEEERWKREAGPRRVEQEEASQPASQP